MSTNAARRTWRNRLFLIGLLPLVLAVLFAGKVGLMLSAQAAGEDAYGKDDFAKAAREFAGNGSLNHLEPWISPFNEGAARHKDEDYVGALEKYDAALKDVPHEEECTVRINMALAHEALGDAALEAGGTSEESADGTADGVAFSSGAAPDSEPGSDSDSEGEPAEDPVKQWQAGRDVLAAGDCPTDSGRGDDQTKDAAVVDERLRQKIEQQKQKQQQQDPQDKKKKEQQEQQKKEKQKKQKQKLDKRNEKGRAQRQKTRDLEDYKYGDSEPGYEW